MSQRNKDIIELCLKVSLQSLIDKNPTGKWIKCLKEFAFGFLTLFSKYSNYKFAKIITAIIMLVWAFAAFPTTFTVESFSSYALKFEGVFAELIREKMAQIIAYLLEIFRNFFQKFTKHTPSAPYARHMIGNCKICNNLPINIRQFNHCEHFYCSLCIHRELKRNKRFHCTDCDSVCTDVVDLKSMLIETK